MLILDRIAFTELIAPLEVTPYFKGHTMDLGYCSSMARHKGKKRGGEQIPCVQQQDGSGRENQHRRRKVLTPQLQVMWRSFLHLLVFTNCVQALGRIALNDPSKILTAIPLTDNKFANLKISDLSVKGNLGAGGFGRVDLVTAKEHAGKYALKRLSKAHIHQNSQEEHVLNEKRVLELLNCVFCVKLEATFKDDRLVTEQSTHLVLL